MRAVVCDRYGPPDVCGSRRSTGRSADPFVWRLLAGLRRPRPRIPGSELASEVTAAGSAVTEFAVGDQVFGLSPWALGAYAEFVCVPAGGLIATKPAGMSFADAAAVCDGALNAHAALKRAKLRQGQRILIYGASGSIGTAAVQLARYLGADVTAVCNTRNLDAVRSLGAGPPWEGDVRELGQEHTWPARIFAACHTSGASVSKPFISTGECGV